MIELMVVISVIAILSTIALFGFNKAQSSARDVSRANIMNGFQTALERYFGDVGSYPTYSVFGSMASVLTSSNYLSAPTDPKSNCSSAIVAASNWTPCGAGSLPTYSYSGNATYYQLVLSKESGGSQTFKSPN